MMSPSSKSSLRVLLLEDELEHKELLVSVIIGIAESIERTALITWSRNAYWATGNGCPWHEFDVVVADAMMPPFFSKQDTGMTPISDARLEQFDQIPKGGSQVREVSVPRGLKEFHPSIEHGGMMVASWLAEAGVAIRGPSLKFILTTGVSAGPELARRAAKFEQSTPWFIVVPKPARIKIRDVNAANLPDGFFEIVMRSLLREHNRDDWGLRLFHHERIVFRDALTRHEVLRLWRVVQLGRERGDFVAVAIVGEEGLGRSTLARAAVKLFLGGEQAVPDLLHAKLGTTQQEIDHHLRDPFGVLWLADPKFLDRNVLAYVQSKISARRERCRLLLIEAAILPRELESIIEKFQLPAFMQRRLDFPGLYAARLRDRGSACEASNELEDLIINRMWSHEKELTDFADWCADTFSAGSPIPAAAIGSWSSITLQSGQMSEGLLVLPQSGSLKFSFNHQENEVVLRSGGKQATLILRDNRWGYYALWHWISRQAGKKKLTTWNALHHEYNACKPSCFPGIRNLEFKDKSSVYQAGMGKLLNKFGSSQRDAWSAFGKARGKSNQQSHKGTQGGFACLDGVDFTLEP